MRAATSSPTAITQVHSDEPRLGLSGSGAASDYAAALLTSLGARVERRAGPTDPHPACDWARSGAMALTGFGGGPPRLAPGPLASCMRGAGVALSALLGDGRPNALDAPALLGERAATFGLGRRRGTTSAGGSCRLLRAADGWIALNLARPDDRALLPAWLGDGAVNDAWAFVAGRVAQWAGAEIVDRGRLLGLPVAVAQSPAAEPPPWFRVDATGPSSARDAAARPLVVDLGSLWAGPLCAQLFAGMGARIVKVESTRRPDGARSGAAAFFDLMNAGKDSVALDFGSEAGRAQLAALLDRADIVIESARPRALAQLGIDAADWVAGGGGRTWISITGYGRREPGANWVAFGDDAGVAAGLATATGDTNGPPIFCGDAIADPLTGIHAAVAGVASWRCGGGHLLDFSLCNVTAHALAFEPSPGAEPATVHKVHGRFEVMAGDERAEVAPPRARPAPVRARELGHDTAAVCAEFDLPC